MEKIKTSELNNLPNKFPQTISKDMVSIFDFGQKGMKFGNFTLTRSKLGLLRLKDVEISDCSITQCIIYGQSYLRHAKFTNVNFTGTVFKDTNLEKAEFINCTMDYVRFENCLINCDSIIHDSLPKLPNLKLSFLNQLYKNELANGNSEKCDQILYLVRDAEKECYKEYIFSNNPYYSNGRNEKFHYTGKYLICVFDKYIWGYGLHIKNMIVSIIMIILIFGIFYLCLAFPDDINFYARVKPSILLSINSLMIGNVIVEIQNASHVSIIQFLNIVEGFVGVLYFALLTSAMYRRIAR